MENENVKEDVKEQEAVEPETSAGESGYDDDSLSAVSEDVENTVEEESSNEDVETIKAEASKAKEEAENYKKAMLEMRAQMRKLNATKSLSQSDTADSEQLESQKKDEEPDYNSVEWWEKHIENKASAGTRNELLNIFQQEALDEFMNDHPEYRPENDPNDIRWTKFKQEFQEFVPLTAMKGPVTKSMIKQRFNKIHNLIESSTPKLKKDEEKETQRSAKEIEAASSVGSGKSPIKEDVKNYSQKTLGLAKQFGVDPETIEKSEEFFQINSLEL